MRGIRISESLVANLVANGMTGRETVDDCPRFELEDIQQALRHAAWATKQTAYIPAVAPT